MKWRLKKECTSCGGKGPFVAAKKGRFGVSSYCVTCLADKQRERRSTPKGRAVMLWNGMRARCGKVRNYTDVELRLTRDEFMSWAVPCLRVWFKKNPGVSPTIDRIRTPGHYVVGNIRIVSQAENSGKTKRNKAIYAKPGYAWCGGKCQRYLSKDKFAPCSASLTGTQCYCRKCSSLYRAERRVLVGRFKTRRVKKRDW